MTRIARILVVAGLAVAAVAATVLAVSAAQPVVPPPLAAASSTPGATGLDADGAPVATPTPSPAASRAAVSLAGRSEPRGVRPVQRDPARLVIPAIGVDTPLEDLGLDPAGALATPVDVDLAGWYADGARPGEVGPAVVAGHVSFGGRPTVFYRLAELTPGAELTVEQDDGRRVAFTVTRVERHKKDDFPTVRVYGPTVGPELRLITCGGDFDRATGHFVDNVVVFATFAGDVG